MTVLTKEEMRLAIRRLATQAAEQCGGVKDTAIVGIRTRGVVLAQRMQREIALLEGETPPLGVLDIALYRDDLLTGGCDAVFKGSEIDFPLEGKTVLLCDDVLYTGRTVRAALSALNAIGRAKAIRLYCLIDRGRRELPFRADGVGKHLPAQENERVLVHFCETDGEDGVLLVKKGENG